ncbi:MAG: FAD-binding oxidoreductase, partial [Amphiplicatus sp.]|nr:FAD-binding oxidoreductase [Amphiplicatus sp.]
MAGASAAYELAGEKSVVLLEMEEHPGYHTTGRSAAFYSEIYGGPVIRALSTASRGFFEAPPRGFAEVELLAPSGSLFIAR